MNVVPPRKRRALLLAVLLGCSKRCASAMFTSCLQRAFTLLQPCQPIFGAVATAPAAAGGGLDVNAALATLGGSLAALPTSVRQCCAALAPVNDANCLCDAAVADAVSTFAASASASAGSIMPQARHACDVVTMQPFLRRSFPQIEQVCGFALKVTQPSGACAVSPAAPAAMPARPPPPDADIMFEITSANTGADAVPIRIAAPSTPPPPTTTVVAAQSLPAESPPLLMPQPPALLALAAAAQDRAECPAQSPLLLALALCAGLCRSDADCHGRHACCSNGCGRVCYAAP